MKKINNKKTTSKKPAKKRNLIKIMILIVSLLLITVGVSYAYFTANITGGESTTTITVGAGTLSITYSGGSAITASNVVPGWSDTKTFTVTGNTAATATMGYTCTLVVQTNTFSAGALKYTMTSTNTGSNGTIMTAVSTPTSIGTSNISLGSGSFAGPASSKVHTYGLTISFPDTGSVQNTDQNKSFTAYVTTASA